MWTLPNVYRAWASTILLDINILHMENLSRLSLKKGQKFFPEAITALDNIKYHLSI